MGDDIGWFNIGAYHHGIMAGRTPNLDQLAAEGMLFTDYYAEASCTAGRANFITGELPIRTGLTTVGQAGLADRHAGAGADHRHRAQVDGLRHRPVRQEPSRRPATSSCRRCTASTSSSAISITSMRWRTRAHRNYPPELKDTVGPRNMLHSWATDTDDPTVQPRWGKVGKQKIEDAGTLYPKRMETVDDEILDHALKFIDKAKARRQAVLPLAEPDAHARRHASLGEVREDAQRRRTAGRSRKPAWRSSTTSSARS